MVEDAKPGTSQPAHWKPKLNEQPTGQIGFNPKNHRLASSDAGMEKLTASMGQVGLLNPVKIRPATAEERKTKPGEVRPDPVTRVDSVAR